MDGLRAAFVSRSQSGQLTKAVNDSVMPDALSPLSLNPSQKSESRAGIKSVSPCALVPVITTVVYLSAR